MKISRDDDDIVRLVGSNPVTCFVFIPVRITTYGRPA
jgi:hypothetical protein